MLIAVVVLSGFIVFFLFFKKNTFNGGVILDGGANKKSINTRGDNKTTQQNEKKYELNSDEKKKLGIRNEFKVEATRRDEAGNILGFKIIYDDNTMDTDGDGLFDHEEEKIGTKKDNPDTDGDGMTDYVEVIRKRNPLIKDEDRKE